MRSRRSWDLPDPELSPQPLAECTEMQPMTEPTNIMKEEDRIRPMNRRVGAKRTTVLCRMSNTAWPVTLATEIGT